MKEVVDCCNGHVLASVPGVGAEVGRDDYLPVVHQRMIRRQGLGVRDVKAGPLDLPFRDGYSQRVVVDDDPARNVDEDGPILHLCKAVFVENCS